MRYRKLGLTGLTVSEVGFGTIPVLKGSVPVLPDYYNLSDAQALSVMEHARSLGCNLYDTAIVPEYGDAELKLGKFAALAGRDRIIISDKARFYDGNEMYRAVETSCENLGTWADIYFVHQVDFDSQDQVFAKGGALDALTELKARGLIRHTGIASHYYDILLRAAADSRVDVLQGSGNVLERGMLDRIEKEPLFRSKGLLINKVYAAGLLPAFFPVEMLVDTVLSYPVSSALIGIGTTEQAGAVYPGKILLSHSLRPLPEVRMPLRHGDPHGVPPVSVLFSGEGTLGAAEAEYGHRGKRPAVQNMRNHGVRIHVSPEDQDSPGDGEGMEIGEENAVIS